MATNLYTFWTGTDSPPSPWSLVTLYDGKYLKCTDAIGNHGTTNGATFHTHSAQSSSIDNGTPHAYANRYFDEYGWWDCLKLHTHSLSFGFPTTPNDPPYRTVRLIKCDLATWEATERKFLENTILPSVSGELTWDQASQDTNFNDRMIKIDSTPETNGGQATRTDTVTATIGSTRPLSENVITAIDGIQHYPFEVYKQYGPFDFRWDSNHNHIITISQTVTTKPVRVRTRIYKTTQLTTNAIAGVVCFVDGTTSSLWTACNWVAAIEGATEDSNLTGSNSHGISFSGSTNTFTFNQSTYNESYSPNITEVATVHSHVITLVSPSIDIQPPYVNLYPVYLNATLSRSALKISSCLF